MNKLNILEISKSIQISFRFQIKLCGVQKDPNMNKTFINRVRYVCKKKHKYNNRLIPTHKRVTSIILCTVYYSTEQCK
jgi:hypothetical protein